jgi:hypothetical protein
LDQIIDLFCYNRFEGGTCPSISMSIHIPINSSIYILINSPIIYPNYNPCPSISEFFFLNVDVNELHGFTHRQKPHRPRRQTSRVSWWSLCPALCRSRSCCAPWGRMASMDRSQLGKPSRPSGFKGYCLHMKKNMIIWWDFIWYYMDDYGIL